MAIYGLVIGDLGLGKINPQSPIQNHQLLISSFNSLVCFMTGSTISNCLGLAVPKPREDKESLTHLMNKLIKLVFVEQPLDSPGSAKESVASDGL